MAVCAGVALALFATSTAPAWSGLRGLREAERALLRSREELGRRIAELGVRGTALDRDPQALLVAIDRLGLTPEELLEGRDPLVVGALRRERR